MRRGTRQARAQKTKEVRKIRLTKKVITMTAIIIAIVMFMIIFAIINLTSKKILPGISINGIDIGGLTLEEARKNIEEAISSKIHNGIKMQHNNQEYIFELNELNIEYAFEEQLQEAYKVGRSGNIIVDNFTILSMYFSKKEFNFDINYDSELLKRQIDYLEVQLPDRVIDYAYYIEDDNLIIIKGLDGVLIDANRVRDVIITQLANLDVEARIEVPVTFKKLEKLSIEEVYNEIYRKAENAYYTTEPFEIHPHVVGVDFAITKEAAEERLSRDENDYLIPLVYTIPETTIENLDIDIFPNLISQFDTTYDVSYVNKENNIQTAVKKLNGTIIKPGEVFSYNKTLGARTVENGYKEAAIYSNGKVVNGLGGGICQVSTTLYNAVLFANLEIVERQNHMFMPSYVKPGCDATVVYGSIDFQFKNTRSYPIKITASAVGGVVRVVINGLFEDEEYTVQLETNKLETTPFETVYITDSTLAKDEENIIQVGAEGVKVETYKIVKSGGIEVSRELISLDTYRPLQETIARGR